MACSGTKSFEEPEGVWRGESRLAPRSDPDRGEIPAKRRTAWLGLSGAKPQAAGSGGFGFAVDRFAVDGEFLQRGEGATDGCYVPG